MRSVMAPLTSHSTSPLEALMSKLCLRHLDPDLPRYRRWLAGSLMNSSYRDRKALVLLLVLKAYTSKLALVEKSLSNS